LRGKLAEVFKSRPRANAEEQLLAEETQIKTELQIVKDDLSSTNSRLKGNQDELAALRKRAAGFEKTISALETELSKLRKQASVHREVIEREEDAIFADFCERIGVNDIREYEQKQLRSAQADNAQLLKLDTHVARLNNQIRFQTEQVDAIKDRLQRLGAVADKHRKALEQCDLDQDAKQKEIAALEQEIKDLRLVLEQLETTHREKVDALETIRKDGSKASKQLDKALKEIAACVSGMSAPRRDVES
jgi:structural maintenance of chromosome 1